MTAATFASSVTCASGAPPPPPPTTPPCPATLPSSSSPDPSLLRAALRHQLLSLSFHAFAATIADLLRELGYEEVRHAGRYQWKGRNPAGGFDLSAYLRVGMNRRRVIVQVKQFDASAPIYQRTIDELRGVSLRVGAAEAILITAGRFSEAVEKQRGRTSEPTATPVAPVQLMDGEELLDQLIEQQVGVIRQPPQQSGQLVLDEPYFHLLSAFCAARENRPRRGAAREKSIPVSANTPAPATGATGTTTVTIRFEGLPQGARPRVTAHR